MDENPYKSPVATEPSTGPPLSAAGPDEAIIRRLIAGVDTEEIVVYDVSDWQLYGRRQSRALTGELAQAAKAAGFRCAVYQSVYWSTLAFFPIKPLGTYLVLPPEECDDPNDPHRDADQYRAVRVPMDWRQVAFHYTVAFAFLVATVGVVLAWIAGR